MAAEAVKAGGRIGPYELLAPIGAGGMGEVWKARDTRLDRVVAIKFSHAQFSERFEREARAIAALNHPNVAALYDVGENYIVMEYVDGEPLRAPDNTRKLLDVAVQIADGLAAAHTAGFVHRDLKPDNILLTKSNRVKILDFGLAKAAVRPAAEDATRTSVTDPGSIVGTTAYMSPEQARGQELDARSDQFSFGLVLYELAAGKRAFARPSAPETLAAIIRDEAEPLPPTVPALLRWIIERLLAKDPEERYASTKDLLADLRSARTRITETQSAGQPAAVQPQRHWPVLPFALGAALAAVCSVAAFFWLRPPRTVAPDVKYTPFATDACRERQPAWSPDGRTVAYTCNVDGIDQVFTRTVDATSAAQLTQGKTAAARPFWSPDGTRVYFELGRNVYFVGATGGVPQLFVKDAVFGSLSPDGGRLAFFRRSEGAIYLANGDGTNAVRYRRPGFPEKSRTAVPRFSPDGKQLALLCLNRQDEQDERELWIAGANGDNPVRSPARFRSYTIAQGLFQWMPDGKHIVLASRRSETDETHLYAINVKSGAQRTLTAGPAGERDPAISPDGTRIAVSVHALQQAVYEFQIDSGKGRSLVERGRTDSAAVWHPSGREFAYISDVAGRAAIFFKADGGGVPRPLSLSGPEVENIQRINFSHDGQQLSLDSYGKEHRVLLVSASGGVPIEVDRARKDTHGASFSPDGAWIVYTRYAADGARITRVSTSGGEPVDIYTAKEPTPGFPVNWSPAGDLIAFLTEGGGDLHVISTDGKTDRVLSKGGYRTFSFGPGGRSIFGLRRGERRQWELWSIDVAAGIEKKLVTLDVAIDKRLFNVNLHPDGKRLLVTVETETSDIWTIDGALSW